jgi:hypothetical protein
MSMEIGFEANNSSLLNAPCHIGSQNLLDVTKLLEEH